MIKRKSIEYTNSMMLEGVNISRDLEIKQNKGNNLRHLKVYFYFEKQNSSKTMLIIVTV